MPAPPHPALPIPSSFAQISTRSERHNARPVTVTRAQPTSTTGYGGQHVTTVVDERGTLYGYTHQSEIFTASSLPTKEQAEQTARGFLASIDPAFAEGLRVQWIDQHDETITTTAGKTVTVSGVKVKTRHSSGLYTWVIVGRGHQIITYERDIVWNSDHSRRQTAMWLHDRWVVARDNGGPELGGMDAPLNS